jgi:hypothetical protein
MARSSSPAEIRELVENTAVMDWPAWGPTPIAAVEEFATAISIGWPPKAIQARTIWRNAQSGQLDPDDGFGLLQDIIT